MIYSANIMNNPSKPIRFLVPFSIIALSIILSFLLFKTKPASEQEIVEEKIWFVNSQIVKKSKLQPVISLIAQSISAEDIEITSAIEADVSQRWINEGDKVKKGHKLLSLDQTTFKLLVTQRKAEQNEIKALIDEEIKRNKTDKALLEKEKSLLAIANNAVTRAQTLEKSEMASSSQLDDAKRSSLSQQIAITQRQAAIENHPIRLMQLKAKLKSVDSRLALAQKDLSHTEILAPVNATVTEITLDQGEHVRKGTRLLKLYNNDRLELKALVPEKYLPSITKAMQNNTKLQGWVNINDEKQAVILERMSGEIQQNSAGSYLYFSINSNTKHYMLGQTFVLELTLPAIDNAFALPSDALYGTDSVFVIQEQRLKRIKVKWLGETRSQKNQNILFLITSNELQDGDTVLISKFANAMHGLKVTTTNSR